MTKKQLTYLIKESIREILREQNIESKIPSGEYCHVDDVRVKSEYRGKGVGYILYQLLLSCSGDNIDGLLSLHSSKLSTATNVSKIYKKLGGNIGIVGKEDTYDVVLKNKTSKLHLIDPVKKGNVIYKSNGIKYTIREISDRQCCIDAYAIDGKGVGYIESTSIYWNGSSETFSFDEPVVGQANQPVKGPLTLVFDNKPVLTANLTTSIGRTILKKFGEDYKFWDENQLTLQKQSDGTWRILPNVNAKNKTMINGKEAMNNTTLSSGMRISVGNPDKKIEKLPITVK